jgi:hypothetical protein
MEFSDEWRKNSTMSLPRHANVRLQCMVVVFAVFPIPLNERLTIHIIYGLLYMPVLEPKAELHRALCAGYLRAAAGDSLVW